MSAEMQKDESEISGEVSGIQKEFGSERIDVLSCITSEGAWGKSSSPQPVWRLEGCSDFFSNPSSEILFLMPGLPCLGCGRTSHVAICGHMTNSTTEHAQIVLVLVLSFFLCKFSVFAKLVSKGIGGSGRSGS